MSPVRMKHRRKVYISTAERDAAKMMVYLIAKRGGQVDPLLEKIAEAKSEEENEMCVNTDSLVRELQSVATEVSERHGLTDFNTDNGAVIFLDTGLRIAVYVAFYEVNVRVRGADTTEIYQEYIMNDAPRPVMVALLNAIIDSLPKE